MKKLRILQIITTALVVGSPIAQASPELNIEEHSTLAQPKETQNKSSSGTIVTVGSDINCDFRLGATRIQDAIDTAPGEIRIAADTYDENLNISDISITIKGGYTNCTDASNDITNTLRQVISAVDGVNLPTLWIASDNQRNIVNLERMTFRGGVGNGGLLPGGGISTIAADLELNLTDITLGGNDSQTVGGGMAIIDGNTDVNMVDVLITGNSAEQGGGLYCASSEASVVMTDTSNIGTGVSFNSATAGNGGGIFLSGGCSFITDSGKIPGNIDFRGIIENSATGNGGGVYIESGASAVIRDLFCPDVFCLISNDGSPANINNNIADSDGDFSGDGGGAYVTGVGSSLFLSNALIEDNTANNGGGIGLADEATLTMRSRYFNGTCWSQGSCSQVTGNQAAVLGGGLYVGFEGTADVANTLFTQNRANIGTAISLSSGTLDLEGSLLVSNGDEGSDGFFDLNAVNSSNSQIKIDFTTIADNNLNNTSLSAGSVALTGTGSMSLISSIVHDPGQPVYFGVAAPLTTDCLIVNEDTSIPNANVSVVVDDPEFIDRLGGDFHLNASNSPAIDFCDTAFSSPDFIDSDNDLRGFDDPLASNNLGAFDVGYDETYENDIIFQNGLE